MLLRKLAKYLSKVGYAVFLNIAVLNHLVADFFLGDSGVLHLLRCSHNPYKLLRQTIALHLIAKRFHGTGEAQFAFMDD